MTIWLLVVLLMASLAGLGYRQGAVRVAFSFVGILLGAVLAAPLGKLIKPILSAVGVKNPLLSVNETERVHRNISRSLVLLAPFWRDNRRHFPEYATMSPVVLAPPAGSALQDPRPAAVAEL